VDHFKRLNDTYGHASGDEVIGKFAGMLRQIAPEGSVLGRIGGEEFALLLEGTTEQGARASAEAIRHTAATQSDKTPPRFTVSAGVAVVGLSESLSEAIRRADSALYQAKRSGRDKVCVAEAA
jgi:diguanylate cyclase (GGDEF)-like protein